MRWDVVLSADQDLAIDAVKQEDESLEMVSGECPLASFAGRLFVELADGEPVEVALFEGDPLIFKLNRDWKGDGRRVRRLTRGHFILIAPRGWTRSGDVPVEPDGCSDRQFMAHYFFSDGSKSSEQIGGFQEYEVALGAVGFELTGESVFDDSAEGHLFVGSPPHLKPTSGVVWARVGKESQDGWSGENFRPVERSLGDVLDGRQGRFFIRVYDRESDLLDSDQFRFLQNLQEIRVNNIPYTQDTLLVPKSPHVSRRVSHLSPVISFVDSSGAVRDTMPVPRSSRESPGHQRVVVEFIDREGTVIRPILPPDVRYLEDDEGSLVIQAHPDADTLSCELPAHGDRVNSTLNLPRVWWRMESHPSERGDDWRDVPLEMTRHEFRTHAESDSALRLRVPKRVRSVVVGFDSDVDRRYQQNDDDFVLPLADFCDYTQIDHWLAEDAYFNVLVENETLALVRVLADRPGRQ